MSTIPIPTAASAGTRQEYSHYDNRAIRNWFNVIYFPAKVAERPATMYVDTPLDSDGNVFQAGKTYKLTVPEGYENNWISTGGKVPFPLFRFYGSEEPLFNNTFILNDVELVE